jgi:site-specific DNA-methyltransferase (adenine-specific)
MIRALHCGIQISRLSRLAALELEVRWKLHSVPSPTHANTRQVLIFDKGPAFGMGDLAFPWKNSFEEIYVIGTGFRADRRDEGVIRGHFTAFSEAQGRVHPNEKPVSLLGYLISRHPAHTILDPFCGSGTTLRAAKDLGRNAIGIEICREYCDIAIQRLQQETLPLQCEQVEQGKGGIQSSMFSSVASVTDSK